MKNFEYFYFPDRSDFVRFWNQYLSISLKEKYTLIYIPRFLSFFSVSALSTTKRFAFLLSPIKSCYLKHFVVLLNQHFLTFRAERLRLKVQGSGYSFLQLNPTQLICYLGFSHLVLIYLTPPIFFQVRGRKKKGLMLWSYNSHLLRRIALQIRQLKQPDQYRGKGVRFFREQLKRKKGKKKFI